MFKRLISVLLLSLLAAAPALGESRILGFPDFPSTFALLPPAQGLPLNWGVRAIRAHLAQEMGYLGERIRIGILDTGIDYTHPYLANAYAGGWDFANDDPDPKDDHGHGTHVAGIVLSIAPLARLYALKVCDAQGSCDDAAVVKALDWALAHGIQVTNSSFGGPEASPLLEAAYEKAWRGGILNVAAAGNDGRPGWCPYSNLNYPGGFRSVLSVGAMQLNRIPAPFSSMPPDLIAPGRRIVSTVPGGGYEAWSGTSMAAPFVTGAAALLFDRRPLDHNKNGRMNDEVLSMLRLWARPLPGGKCIQAQQGQGLVDALEGVR